MRKNSRLARSLPTLRINSGGMGPVAAAATKAATATSTKATSATPGTPTGNRQPPNTTRARTAEKVAISTPSTKVSCAPASDSGITPNGSVATTATNSHAPRAGRRQINPTITIPASPAAGTSGDVAATNTPTPSAATPAASSIVRLARSTSSARITAP